MALPDKRISPWREDLAAAHLEGKVPAARFVSGKRMHVSSPVADLLAGPGDAALASQLILGEPFDVYETRSDGLSWGQSARDGYVGCVQTDQLTEKEDESQVTTTALSALLYPLPNIKTVPLVRLPMGSQVGVLEETEDFLHTPIGYLPKAHTENPPSDPVSAAERFLSIPYLWGGRSSFGLDCSALVQVMMSAASLPCPRDSDLQVPLGSDVSFAAKERGDLVFWKGHVGIMTSNTHLLHANAHHMCVAFEPLEHATKRIASSQGGPITAIRRVL